MKQVEILAQIGDYRAADVYSVISDFQRYPHHSKAVRAVNILEANADFAISAWEVNFRQGILQWTEEDRFDRDNNMIHFNQLEGDADHFSGHWRVIQQGQLCQVQFLALFDMGIPTMSDIIEPIAERALRENIQSIIEGLFAERVVYLN